MAAAELLRAIPQKFMSPLSLINYSTRAVDALAALGASRGGLWPSILDRHSGRPPEDLPPEIPGQRHHDRAFRGANLMHEFPTLAVCTALGRGAAADDYFRRFAVQCTDSPSGLFPWGEHLFWDIEKNAPGNSNQTEWVHDHLLQFPAWAWEQLWQHNAAACQRFGRGLDNHWRAARAGEPDEYNRHARFDQEFSRPPRDDRSCDFPRHSGFYIFDWAFLFSKTGAVEWLGRIETMADYWWQRRDENDLCLIESRTPPHKTQFYNRNHAGQTLSLGVSLLESANLLGTIPLADVLRERGATYCRAFLQLPHELDDAVIVTQTHRASGEVAQTATLYGTRYGETSAAAPVGVLCLAAWSLLGDEAFLVLARAIGKSYLEATLPADIAVPAKDAGQVLELLAGLLEIEAQWREPALKVAVQIADAYFDTAALPRRASGDEWYESQTLPGYLLHGLTRVALLCENDPRLAADWTAR